MSTPVKTAARLDARFAQLREQGRKALVCYVTAGYPNRARSIATIQALAAAGADVIEVGVPFSDPMADGPVIQASSQRALEQGTTLNETLAMIREAAVDVPVVLFSYLNPVLAAGPDILERAHQSGCSGILITDLPVGADPEREAWLSAGPLDFVRLVAPTTPPDRVREIDRSGSGFVYLISRLGVTGARQELPPELGELAARTRAAVQLPVCVGFGVCTAEQARAVAAVADGVVVGTAIVAAAGEGVEKARALVRAMRDAMDGSSVS